MNDREFLARFEAAAIPSTEWGHREHIRVAYLYLRELDFPVALDRIRKGIQQLNRANEVPENESSGYHETVTVAWARLVSSSLVGYGPERDFEAFALAHPHLLVKTLLRLYYSRAQIVTAPARRHFVAPDLGPLPGSQELSPRAC